MEAYSSSMPEISFEDFAKLDMRIGAVVAAEMVQGADKLIKCTVDFGDLGVRTIVSGIAEWKRPEELVGKQFPYVVNLAPRVLRGVESRGMLLACSDEHGAVLLAPSRDVPPGTKLK